MTKKLLGLVIFSGLALTLSGNPGLAQSKPRARDLGVPFQGTQVPLMRLPTLGASMSATPH